MLALVTKDDSGRDAVWDIVYCQPYGPGERWTHYLRVRPHGRRTVYACAVMLNPETNMVEHYTQPVRV